LYTCIPDMENKLVTYRLAMASDHDLYTGDEE